VMVDSYGNECAVMQGPPASDAQICRLTHSSCWASGSTIEHISKRVLSVDDMTIKFRASLHSILNAYEPLKNVWAR
jgi:hypothetical protein